jgi:phosphopantothenoylcysteine decarboxylase/phosphopantothenate--cysteine ligase
MLTDKRILLIIGGGIAAYKALELIRRLRDRGAVVRAVMTPAAQQFITPLSVSSLSGEKTYTDLFSLTDEAEMGHIQLSRWAHLLVVAPATADFLAKLATGQANDLASTLALATDKRVLLAPAMNVRMWTHPATQRNVAQLAADGLLFVGPENGAMACGEFGPGRMAEPDAIARATEAALESDGGGALAGKRVVVTSGPTHEPIDPVRYIANRSSGRQGHAIAAAAARAGADVVLISGPVDIADPPGVTVQRVETAAQMLAATQTALPADVFIAAAAVADWRLATPADQKIKKGRDGPPTLTFAENPDILATVARAGAGRPRLVVGFAAETQDILLHAHEKLERKGCDLIVANDVSPGSGVMGGTRNTVHLVTADGVDSWPSMEKDDVATALVTRCAAMIAERSTT